MININIFTEKEDGQLFLFMLDRKRFPESEYHIVENSDEDIVWDLVVVYEGMHRPHTVRCRKGGLVFISGEPPMSRVYATPFLKQFDTLITQHPKLHHPRNIQWHPCMNWHVGIDYSQNFKSIFSFDQLESLPPMEKTCNISMITSALRMMPGHNRRMNFVEALKQRFGDKIDLYGRGIRPIDTKYEALKDYRFAICIENSSIPHYWTEKFADPILSYTVPIYFGCTNINDYFAPRCYISIDINNTEAALAQLQQILDNAEAVYQEHLPYVKEARRKLMAEYCLFPTLMEKFALHLQQQNAPESVTLRPCATYWQHKWLHRKLRLTRLMYKLKLGGGKKHTKNLPEVLPVDAAGQGAESREYPFKLSIVVPVYNVEKYVRRCLLSIFNQEGVDKSLYEVIIINDGSTDNSLAVVNETVAGRSNVSVQSSQNFGLSAARNRGTLSAQGEYIWYIDSDDWIEPDAIKTLLPYMDGKNDIVQFGWNEAYADATKKVNHRRPVVTTGEDCLLHGDWPMGVQFSIYHREWDTHKSAQFSFVEGIYHEDNEFTPRVILSANRVTVVDCSLYNYFKGNPNSTLTKPNIKKCYDLITVARLQAEYGTGLRKKEIRSKYLDFAALAFNTSLRLLNMYDQQDQDTFLRRIDEQGTGFVTSFLHCGKRRYCLMALFIRLTSVRLYVKVLQRTKG